MVVQINERGIKDDPVLLQQSCDSSVFMELKYKRKRNRDTRAGFSK